MMYGNYRITDMNEPSNYTIIFCEGISGALRYVEYWHKILSFEGTPNHVIVICQKTKISIDLEIMLKNKRVEE